MKSMRSKVSGHRAQLHFSAKLAVQIFARSRSAWICNQVTRCLLVVALSLTFVTKSEAQAVGRSPSRLPSPIATVITVGQSNAINQAPGGPYISRHPGKLFQINVNDGTISAASDPLLGVGDEPQPPAATSFMLPLGDLLMDTGKYGSVLIAPIAVGSTCSANWAAGGAWNPRITTIANELAHFGIKTTMVLWMEGECEGAGAGGTAGMTTAQYQTNVRSVQHTFAVNGITAPFFVSLETVCLSRPNPTIRAAQVALVDNVSIFAGPDFDTLLGSQYRWDTGQGLNGCHFNETADWNRLAPMWAAAIKAALH